MGCANHPAVETGLQQCWVCAQPFCAECVVEFQSRTLCGPCKQVAVARLESGSPDAVGGEGEPAPWERRAELGLVAAFVATCKASMLEPQRLFSRLDRTRQTYDCLGFVVVVHVLVALSQGATNFVIFSILGAALPFQGSGGDNPFMSGMFAGMGLIGVLLSPIVAVIYAFVFSGSFHLALVVMKKATVPYHQTLRGYCYGAAPYVIGLVPLIGPSAGMLWAVVSQIFMVKERHRCSGGTAAIAVLWLAGIVMCCGGIAAVAMIGLAARGR